MKFSDWSLKKKLITVSISLPAIMSLGLLLAYSFQSKSQSVDSVVQKSRAIVLAAESAREEMEQKWAQGIFSVEQLQAWQKAGRTDLILGAVPVVTAWNTAMLKSKEGGYTFKVPKFHPRNPTNEPDSIEARILRMMASRNLSEYYEIDPTINAVRYFRPVRLTPTCLICHGDPVQSRTLWGRSDGRDPTGGPMENWNTGEMHGAFQVIQSLSEADSITRSSIAKGTITILISLAIMAFIIITIIAFQVEKPISYAVAAMVDGTKQVTEASGQVAETSQNIAEATTNQAEQQEEMSAHIQDVAQMTHVSSQNAKAATHVAGTAKQQADEGRKSMQQLHQTMSEIKSYGNQMSEIIKTINEIAFQTNLLALNASVEAARAGDAGKGFAVVADEVRSLAERCAQAAQSTESLIKNANKQSENGSVMANQVMNVVQDIATGSEKVMTLIKEIADSLDGQAKATAKLAVSVQDLDRSTQSNAAAAEQSASTSEELTAQAESLREVVHHITKIIQGVS
jgi:methyl-accepting chemotaxis protein